MAYIGNKLADAYTSFAKQDFTTSATTSYTLDYPVANENEIALFINFVRQEPTTAYSASGTSLTLTSATSASDDMYCVFLGKALQTVNPPAGSVGTSQLVDSAVTFDKLSGQNYPAFMVTRQTTQAISNNTDTKIQFNNEIIDTDSAFDSTTNYRFTVPSGKGGNYLIYLQVTTDMGAVSNYSNGYIRIKKNGTDQVTAQQTDARSGTLGQYLTLYSSALVSLSATDYLEGWVTLSDTSGTPSLYGENNDRPYTCMYAYRIGA